MKAFFGPGGVGRAGGGAAGAALTGTCGGLVSATRDSSTFWGGAGAATGSDRSTHRD